MAQKLISAPHYFNIISAVFDQIHNLLNHYVFDLYHEVAGVVQYPLALCLTIYLVLLGYSISQGWVNLSITGLVKITIKLGVIYSLAINWGIFSYMIISFFQQGSNELSGILLMSSDHFHSINSQQGIETALQTVLIHFTKISYWLWRRGSWHSITPYCEAIVIWGSGIILISFAMIQLIVANIMLSILFVMAPIFFSFTIFKSTQPLFDRWLGYIIAYALMMLFVSMTLAFFLNITQWSISGISANTLFSSLYISSFVPIVLVCFVNIALVKRSAKIAYDIGLSFSSVSMSQDWSALIGNRLNMSVNNSPLSTKRSGNLLKYRFRKEIK